MQVQAGSIMAGRYTLEERLDTGGQAMVWRATDSELERPVAVKILVTPDNADPSFVEVFHSEAQAEAALKHPNIVEVFDWGQDRNANYIVMELLSGLTIRQALDAEGRFPSSRALTISTQAASALAYAHNDGVQHGTIDAQRIIAGADGHTTIISFGLRCRGACEQPPTPDADTYALGGVMYEMLTGASPFGPPPADAPAGQPWPVHPSALAPDVSSEFDRIVMKAIAPDPAARYQNAAQLHADLEAMAAPKKRHTGLWIAAAVVALALVAAGVWFLTTQQNAVVPGVVGVASADASATLVRAGFTMVVSGSRASSVVASDAVLSESPGAGKTVRKGSQIAVVVSTGKPMATVPGLAGLTLQAASSKIAAAGLVVGNVTSQASSVFPASSVLTQVPSAGTETTLGAEVDLIVSSGARQVTVLDVRSTSQTTAVARLTGQGLLVDVGESFSSQPVGIVVSQAPSPGSNVPVGSTVTISVSKGPAPVTVPDVKGAAAADAKTSLEEIGLVPVTVAASGTAAQKGTVIDQDPEPGTQVSAGSKVTIMVGK